MQSDALGGHLASHIIYCKGVFLFAQQFNAASTEHATDKTAVGYVNITSSIKKNIT